MENTGAWPADWPRYVSLFICRRLAAGSAAQHRPFAERPFSRRRPLRPTYPGLHGPEANVGAGPRARTGGWRSSPESSRLIRGPANRPYRRSTAAGTCQGRAIAPAGVSGRGGKGGDELTVRRPLGAAPVRGWRIPKAKPRGPSRARRETGLCCAWDGREKSFAGTVGADLSNRGDSLPRAEVLRGTPSRTGGRRSRPA